MSADYVALKLAHWGLRPQVRRRSRQLLSGLALIVVANTALEVAAVDVAAADPAPTLPDPPPAARPVVVPRGTFAPSWDLDGVYLWLGPVGAASYVDARWDSTVGGEAALVVVRERAPLGLAGVNVGASRWTARGGGRVWVDGLIGTQLAGRMLGASIGPIVELSEIAHPKLGASIGVWAFAGITPFARIGAVADLGMFAEVGIHIALPVLRR